MFNTQLMASLIEEWDNMPTRKIHGLINYMHRRICAVNGTRLSVIGLMQNLQQFSLQEDPGQVSLVKHYNPVFETNNCINMMLRNSLCLSRLVEYTYMICRQLFGEY